MRKVHGNSKYHNILTKDFLIQEYTVNLKSCTKIAKIVICHAETVRNYLKLYKIMRRTASEVTTGTNNPNYADGRSYKQYYCSVCETKISKASGFNGSGMCTSCGNELWWQDSEYRANQIKKRKELWKNKEYKEKHLKAMKAGCDISPNKPETLLIKLLNKILPTEYKFVGSWDLFIRGFNPDFVNKDNTKIIEMYGDYWHKKKGIKETDNRRIKAYTEAGYKTLIIWEHELENINKVTKKILKFNKK